MTNRSLIHDQRSIEEYWCPGPESNRHAFKGPGILSPVRLPISPPGRTITAKRRHSEMEAGVGIEPASTALQAAA